MTRMLLLLSVVLVLLGGCGAAEHDAEAMETEVGDQVTLADGTDVRVSSPDRQEIWVQFREEGDGWTEPEKVYEESNRWTHEVELEQAGDTVAINPNYWRENELIDDFAPDGTVQIICHDGSCTDAVVSTSLATTQFSEDGTAAWFDVDGPTLAFWGAGDGQRSVTLEGVAPNFEYDIQEDGSLVALTGRRLGENCEIALLTVAPGETTTEEVAVSAEYPGGRGCPVDPVYFEEGEITTTNLTTLTDVDRLEWLDESNLITFTRDGEWTVEQEENPLYEVTDTLGQRTLGTIRLPLPDGSIVAIGSVDRIRITAQVVRPLSDEWSPPAEIFTAPKGTVCRILRDPNWLDADAAVIPPAFAVVRCGEDDGSPLRRWRHTQGFTLTSTDGYEWSVRSEP